MVVAVVAAALVFERGPAIVASLLGIGAITVPFTLAQWAAARASGVRIVEVCFGNGPKLFQRRNGDRLLGVAMLPVGGFLKFAEPEVRGAPPRPGDFQALPRRRRAAIILVGPLATALACFALAWAVGAPTGGLGRSESGMRAFGPYRFVVVSRETPERAWWDAACGAVSGAWECTAGDSAVRDFAGPVGLIALLVRAADHGPSVWLGALGVTAVCLFLFNLLPIPLMAGGMIASLLIEAVRGRRATLPQEIAAQWTGLLLLLAWLVVTTVNDVRALL